MPNFAALEQRLNRAAVRLVSNASATWLAGGLGRGAPVVGLRVVFDREGGPGLDGLVNDFNPVVSACAADMPGAARGDVLQITTDTPDAQDSLGTVHTYEVSRATADGTGLLVLHLVQEGAL